MQHFAFRNCPCSDDRFVILSNLSEVAKPKLEVDCGGFGELEEIKYPELKLSLFVVVGYLASL